MIGRGAVFNPPRLCHTCGTKRAKKYTTARHGFTQCEFCARASSIASVAARFKQIAQARNSLAAFGVEFDNEGEPVDPRIRARFNEMCGMGGPAGKQDDYGEIKLAPTLS